MDNFMDKLAEKYNAQDMIRANSQAETAQMQSLQDQVEAYEAVLQEMRKLNYKNTELTEKMYALVDASIEKVRTLQLEASEGSVSTAEVSREMQDAVNRAVSEAISSMDETMARTLSESLQQPTDEMRQSNERMAEDVRNSMESSLQTFRDSTEMLRSVTASVNEKMQGMDAQFADMKEGIDTVQAEVREVSAATDLIRDALEHVKRDDADLKDILQGSLLEDIHGNKEMLESMCAKLMDWMDANARKEQEAESIRFASEAEKEKEISNREVLDAIQDRLFSVQQSNTNTEESVSSLAAAMRALREDTLHTEAPQEVLDRLQDLSDQVAGICEKQQEPDEEARAAAEKMEELLETLRQQVKFTTLTQETLSALTQANTQTQDSLTEMRTALDGLKEQSAQGQTRQEMVEKLTGIEQEGKASKEGIFFLRTAYEEQKGGIEELKGIGNDTKAGLMDIYESLEKAKNGISEIKAQQMLPQVRPGEEEMRQALTELLSGHSELITNLRNLKGATDDTKTTVKSALDTAIYGLKQDNKELVGILQRMNATLTSRNDEQEKAQKEEEERARAEEDKRQLEERFKLTEDFMHKESVKVYRNVQAVINEKNEKQKENLDNSSQSVLNGMMKVKVWAIISTIVGGANLVLVILRIFGILK